MNKVVTIYSFRHSGVIEIFKRTESLTKLQKAMGYSSLNVSLTYLRGLEIAELTVEDMPTMLHYNMLMKDHKEENYPVRVRKILSKINH